MVRDPRTERAVERLRHLGPLSHDEREGLATLLLGCARAEQDNLLPTHVVACRNVAVGALLGERPSEWGRSGPACRKRSAAADKSPVSPAAMTCIEALADGWLSPADLCTACTRAFMDALDRVGGPLRWHENFVARAER